MNWRKEMDWNKILKYSDGKLYWKLKEVTSQYIRTWNKKYAGKETGYDQDYRKMKFNKRLYPSHRIVWELHNGKIPDGLVVDHINSNKFDNRIENLQLLTQAQNIQRKKISQGYVNIKGRYRAIRTFNGVSSYLGYFGTPCGAKMAFNTFFIGGNKLSLT